MKNRPVAGLLPALMQRGQLEHFEIAHPSLHDIFVRIVRPEAVANGQPEAEEVSHA